MDPGVFIGTIIVVLMYSLAVFIIQDEHRHLNDSNKIYEAVFWPILLLQFLTRQIINLVTVLVRLIFSSKWWKD